MSKKSVELSMVVTNADGSKHSRVFHEWQLEDFAIVHVQELLDAGVIQPLKKLAKDRVAKSA